MLKQKIRKSRKNLLSLLESASFYGEDSEGGKREGKGGKRGKEEERRKGLREVSPGLADEGYSTAGEKTSPSTSPGGSELGETLRTVEEGRIDKSKEVRRGEERPVRGQAVPVVGAQQATWGVPVILAVGRRSSPQEDFLWSLQGVHSLIQQQNKLLGDIRERLGSQEEEKKMEAPYLSMHHLGNQDEKKVENRSRADELRQLRQFSEQLSRVVV